jgi:transposase-like protein
VPTPAARALAFVALTVLPGLADVGASTVAPLPPPELDQPVSAPSQGWALAASALLTERPEEVPMPWREASPMDQRTRFIADHLRDAGSITELCVLYGVSRKTGYKWIDRYLRQGPAGLEERSRRPRRSPNETSDEIVTAIAR